MDVTPPAYRFDAATALGIGAAFALVIAAMVLSGSAYAFMDVPAMLIVLGGTAAVTTACFTLKDMRMVFHLIARTVVYPHYHALKSAEAMIDLARHARKHNLLALQNNLAHGKLDYFVEKGLAMVVDGVETNKIEQLLLQDLHSLNHRHAKGVQIFRKAAEVAPAMGLIGTLVGLVQMLSNLADPTMLGPAMAIALLTTLYGALLAYLVFTPLATKLERNTQEELIVRTIQLHGIMSIAQQENPRQLELTLATLVPPHQRYKSE